MVLLTVAEGLYPFETFSGRIGYIDTWEKAGKNLLISAPNDSLYILDTDFQLLNASGLTPEEKNYRFANNVHYIQLFTAFRDSVLYYNYSNDTIYRAVDTGLVPRWVIDMQDYKLPAMTAEKKKKLVEELSRCIRNGLGSTDPESVIKTGIDASELVRLAKGKKLIYAVYETKNYVFITWSDYDNINAELRQLDSYPPQLAYYDKRTGKTVVVEGRGLIDDMDRYDEIYYPTFGIYENKLIAYFWPYELHEKIQERQAAGKKVSLALLDLAARVDDEDNPILMVAYLKE